MYTPEEMKIIHEEVTRLRKEGDKPDPMLDKNSEEFKKAEKEAWRLMWVCLAISLTISGLLFYFFGPSQILDLIYVLTPYLPIICISIFSVSLIISVLFGGEVWLFNSLTYWFGAFSIISLLNYVAMRHFL